MMWVEHPSFIGVVKKNWEAPKHGNPGHIFAKKLIRLHRELKRWNWEIFRDLHRKKSDLNGRIQSLELQLSNGWEDEVHQEWENCKKEILQVEKWESEMLCQQARMDWMKDGDRNSKLFHAVIKERRKKRIIQIQQPNGEISTSPSEIGELAQDFFSDLFSASPYHMEAKLFDGIPSYVSDWENMEFCRIPKEEEILAIIKEMNANGAPGNDGFTGHFFSACWDVIKTDLGNFIQDFFQGSYIPKEISSITLALLPKVEHARNMGDFRPISLGNFCGMIISKILASRLAKILPGMVDEEQAGFVHERSIATHIVLAQELIRDINRKVTRGNVAFKIDMSKAYNWLELRFLQRALEAFGFSPHARDLIYRNICNIWYSFRINGEYYGSFRSLHGVRQGDPLSPLLFVLAQQVLSHNLK